MKKIVIIGCGPRGLAMALRASLYKNYEVVIIDPNPLITWSFPYMMEDVLMRSPISFDLTTLCPDIQKFSLANYLNYSYKYNNQFEVEYCDIFCSRLEFINYLKYIFNLVKSSTSIKFIFDQALLIKDGNITCNTINVNYDYLIISTGKNNHCIDCPSYLKNKPLITLQDLLLKRNKSKYLNVIGSGQQAAEIVEYAARQNLYVNWIQKHTPIIKQYPSPSIQDWGIKSALSSYYSTLHRSDYKNNYLKEVKEWGPSITPHIALKLEEVNYSILKPTTTEHLNKIADNILALGFKQEIKLLDVNFNLALDPQAFNFPQIQKDFQSSSHSNIYFTGLLALRFDGPRQGSIISAAQTANKIMQNILNN
jgi:pyruvate/2-oxoglutarate dehydrogenase complex dihydrolipoamide dehydrogenase (E3) component